MNYEINELFLRVRRQIGGLSYEYDSDTEESGTWGDWGPPSQCSRYRGWGFIHSFKSVDYIYIKQRECEGVWGCVGGSISLSIIRDFELFI